MHPTRALATWLGLVALFGALPAVSQEADVQELSRLENVWNEAHLKGDAEALDKLWADDLVLSVPRMPVLSKADVIGMWRSARPSFTRYETSDIRVRVYGDAAVVTGRLQRSRDFGGRVADEDWRFTKVYARHAGQWRVVAFHASEAAK